MHSNEARHQKPGLMQQTTAERESPPSQRKTRAWGLKGCLSLDRDSIIYSGMHATGESGRPRYQLGTFEVDLGIREMPKYGVRIPLQTQPFEVLTCLLERAGQVVTRTELRERLWGSEVHVDFEHSLNRAALGESAGAPGFIATLTGRGYLHASAVGEEHAAAIEPAGVTAGDW